MLVGDAAHTINPMVGQVVNRGFKDLKALVKVIRSALEQQENIADDRVLARYQQKRKTDNLLMQSGMDLFYKAFKEDILPFKVLRNLALVAADKNPLLKNRRCVTPWDYNLPLVNLSITLLLI